MILTAEIDLLTPNPYIKTQKWPKYLLKPSKFAKKKQKQKQKQKNKHFSWPLSDTHLEKSFFLGGTPHFSTDFIKKKRCQNVQEIILHPKEFETSHHSPPLL